LIKIKFLGGAKKIFSVDYIEIEKTDITIEQLLEHLIKNNLHNNNRLDTKNLLVAVNGIDSSAMDGSLTKLKHGDIVSIIPIIHGGSSRRIQFNIINSYVELFEIKANQKLDINFLDDLRRKFSSLVIQAISAKYVIGKSHAEKIIAISQMAQRNKILLSKKIETDILLRFAGTTQIVDALERVGIKPGNSFILIAIGKQNLIEKLYQDIKPLLNTPPLLQNNQNFLRKKFNITKKQIDSIASKSPLEDILSEKAAILF
jgi:tRNA threonylcarbamoyladenosine modification (KEOPS) complex Cgi121 subunit/molybdopterin converting factor small subunit